MGENLSTILQNENVVENERSGAQPTVSENSEQGKGNASTCDDNPYNLRKLI